jgi:hypothetical protein
MVKAKPQVAGAFIDHFQRDSWNVDRARCGLTPIAARSRAVRDNNRMRSREESNAMSIASALKLFVLALIVLAVAFGLRRTFFFDVMPVSWDQDPQSLWALGAAFLLRTLENLAVVVAVLAVIVAGVSRLLRWRAAAQTDSRMPGME